MALCYKQWLHRFHLLYVPDTTNVSIIIVLMVVIVLIVYITCQSCADSATVHSAVTGAGLTHYFIEG